ncbi:type III secretion protein [Pseudomonas sp. SWRI92]|uniref:type III secretion protein n=1 Tax=Pseudomonas sp. SWRI92 TaxID=2745499 RepID=UPI001644B507|nr:type III secretion protein [Pseudomonas sp. SWRI92]MBC3372389.1 type III secretion protein [Pseudomonas sp. SWRI92]
MTAVPSPLRQAWQTLLDQPLAFVNTRHLHECWSQPLTAQQHAALYTMPRFQERLLQQLMGHFRLPALALVPPPDEQDLAVLLLSPEAFKRLPRLCGAIWHAQTLSREIRSDRVNLLRNALGSEVFALALAHRLLAGAADLLREPAELLEAIDHDGARCVTAWLQRQPAGLRDWLRLRLDLTQVDDSPSTADPNIVRRAAAAFGPPDGEVAG